MLVLGVGIGVIILIVLWTSVAITILLCGHKKLLVTLLLTFITFILSVLLLLFPQHSGPQQPPPEDKVRVFNILYVILHSICYIKKIVKFKNKTLLYSTKTLFSNCTFIQYLY